MDKLRKFLNNTPPEFIQRFLESFSRIGWDEIDWMAKPRSRSPQIEQAIGNTTEKNEARIKASVDQIEKIADERGRQSLRDVLNLGRHDMAVFDELPDPRACAIWVRQISDDLFDRALETDYAERNKSPRKWSGFRVAVSEPGLHLDNECREAFYSALRQILDGAGSRNRLHVEWLERTSSGDFSGETHRCFQATIYHEAPPRSEAAFSGADQIEYAIRRPVIEGAVVLEPETGMLDIVATGGKKIRKEIANAFASTVLGEEQDLELVEARMLDLSSLAEPRRFDYRDEDGIEDVEVSSIRLISPGSSPLFVTIDAGSAGVMDEGDLYHRMAQMIGSPPLGSRHGWRVVSAVLRIRFRPASGSRRSKIVRVELNLPNRTNLRENTERERLISNVLLDRWGIYPTKAGSNGRT